MKMSYTADPVADALAYDDEQEAYAERAEAIQVGFEIEIDDAFADFSKLPLVTARINGTNKIIHQEFDSAVIDLMADDKIFAKLIDVLKTSQCEKVQGLVVAMKAEYKTMWLSDLVEAV
jgi:hypothetical protein